ncbi:MAG: hypothetical protein AAGC56_09110 [Pseudomonadota bacterium]
MTVATAETPAAASLAVRAVETPAERTDFVRAGAGADDGAPN